jgi:hypothetical protein
MFQLTTRSAEGDSVNSVTKEPVSMWLMTQRQKRRRSRIHACLFLQPVARRKATA